MAPFVIVIFGSPGAGKSETVRALAHRRKSAMTIVEPTERLVTSGALEAVCRGNVMRAGYTAQMLMLVERAATYWATQAQMDGVVEAKRRPWLVLDGHISLDVIIYPRVHERRGVMSARDTGRLIDAYEHVIDTLPKWAHHVAVYVHLRPGAAECYRRASTLRQRDAERALTRDDFNAFEAACDNAAAELRADGETVIVIDSSAIDVEATVDCVERAALDACVRRHGL